MATSDTTKCRWCTHFGRWADYLVAGQQVDGKAALCVRLPQFPVVHVHVEGGCAFFERAPGADDEVGEISPAPPTTTPKAP